VRDRPGPSADRTARAAPGLGGTPGADCSVGSAGPDPVAAPFLARWAPLARPGERRHGPALRRRYLHHRLPRGGGLLRPIWRALAWPFTARTAARELRDAHDALLRRYQELDETRARLEATQAQLAQAGKLAALGQLGAGIAHELNQPIQSIRGFAQRVLRRGDTRVADNVDELERIIVGADRMARIVEGIRLFSCDSTPTLAPLEAFAPINAALDLLGRQLKSRGISVTGPSSSAALPPIRGDRVQLEQVFVNLLINARDALCGAPANGGRRIRIDARQEGDHAVFVVEDNGPGVPDSVAKRIFDPFFTTKGPDQGTGLGLSISYGIIKEHNGELLHERPASGGARFVVRLPLSGAPPDIVTR